LGGGYLLFTDKRWEWAFSHGRNSRVLYRRLFELCVFHNHISR